MDWISKSQLHYQPYWPAVERVLAGMPPPLFRQAVLLKDNLATFYSGSGQFQDILSRPHDHPLLYWHLWLLDDLGLPDPEKRRALEQQLFLGMVFTFAAVYTQETIRDEGSNFDAGYLFLGQALRRQADLHFHALFPAASPFWQGYEAYWAAYAAATLEIPQAQAEALLPLIPQKLAFTKLSIAAAAFGAGQEALLSEIEPLLDGVNTVWQILRDITTLRRDLARRVYSYPILKTMQKAGLDPQRAFSPEQLLGAFVLSGMASQLGQECLAHLDACRTRAVALRLPTFGAYCEGVEGMVQEVMALFSLKSKKSLATPEKPARAVFASSAETLPKVIEMAEGYLLADTSFRESWEIQRRGVFGLSEMTGRAFPAGLIVEILCGHGHPLAAPLNTIFETLQQTGFRYYDHDHLPPDTDDLALLLRLYPYSPQPDIHRAMVQPPLGWLQTSLDQTGQIPVWLRAGEAEGEPKPLVALWGNRCAAVEANLLLGLIAFDWPGYRSVVEQAVISLSRRWSALGLGATAHYAPLYSLWVTFELIARLPASLSPEATESLERLKQALLSLLEWELKRPTLSAQDAAFLSLTCLTGGDGWLPRLKPEWLTLLGKRQRYDGSWAGEPLYGTPTRGEFAAWYSSRSVTTAFCYHALKRYQAI